MTSVDTLSEDVPFDPLSSDGELEAHCEHITTFTEDTVEAAGADGAVIGLSDGIGSTLTALFAVETLGKESLHGFVVPSVANDKNMTNDAGGVAEVLGIEYDVAETRPIAETFLNILPEAVDDRMVVGNAYVRTRAVLNHSVVNCKDRIVLGTGNRAGAITGYFTKHGDQAVDCNPIGDLYKQQVHQLVTHIGVSEGPVLQTPSAEVWSGQTGEGEFGPTYDTLDVILALHVDGPLSKSATVRHLGVTEEQVDRVTGLVEGNVHERSMPPAPSTLDM